LAASLLEIVELASGEVVLRRPGGEGEPLVRIHFSADSREYLSDARLEIARAMIEAGIQTAAHLAGGEAELEFRGPDGCSSADDSRYAGLSGSLSREQMVLRHPLQPDKGSAPPNPLHRRWHLSA
jgi:hypothetical protein